MRAGVKGRHYLEIQAASQCSITSQVYIDLSFGFRVGLRPASAAKPTLKKYKTSSGSISNPMLIGSVVGVTTDATTAMITIA